MGEAFKGGRRWAQPQLRRVLPRVTTWEELDPTADGVIFRGTDGGVRWDIVVHEREAGAVVVALDLVTRAEFEACGDTLQEAVGAVRTAAWAAAARLESSHDVGDAALDLMLDIGRQRAAAGAVPVVQLDGLQVAACALGLALLASDRRTADRLRPAALAAVAKLLGVCDAVDDALYDRVRERRPSGWGAVSGTARWMELTPAELVTLAADVVEDQTDATGGSRLVTVEDLICAAITPVSGGES